MTLGPFITEGFGQTVSGRCPSCGSNGTLYVAAGQHITCSLLGCPDPVIVADFLSDPGPTHHIVTVDDESWHLQHPMRCRLDGLADCLYTRAFSRDDYDLLTEPGIGRHRVEMISGLILFRAEPEE